MNKKEIKLKGGHTNHFFVSWDKDGNVEQNINIVGLQNQLVAADLLAQSTRQIIGKSRDIVDLIVDGLKQCKDDDDSEALVDILKRFLTDEVSA